MVVIERLPWGPEQLGLKLRVWLPWLWWVGWPVYTLYVGGPRLLYSPSLFCVLVGPRGPFPFADLITGAGLSFSHFLSRPYRYLSLFVPIPLSLCPSQTKVGKNTQLWCVCEVMFFLLSYVQSVL